MTTTTTRRTTTKMTTTTRRKTRLDPLGEVEEEDSMQSLLRRSSMSVVEFEDDEDDDDDKEVEVSHVEIQPPNISKTFADGIAYSCADRRRRPLHGENSTRVRRRVRHGLVRALQNVGYTMKHGDKIVDLLLHPQQYMNTDVNTCGTGNRTGSLQDDPTFRKRCSLRPESRLGSSQTNGEGFSQSSASLWPITALPNLRHLDDDDTPDELKEKARLEAAWNKVTPASKEEFISLMVAAYRAAVVGCTRTRTLLWASEPRLDQ